METLVYLTKHLGLNPFASGSILIAGTSDRFDAWDWRFFGQSTVCLRTLNQCHNNSCTVLGTSVQHCDVERPDLGSPTNTYSVRQGQEEGATAAQFTPICTWKNPTSDLHSKRTYHRS